MDRRERKRDARELTVLIGAALSGSGAALAALLERAAEGYVTGTLVAAVLAAAQGQQRAALQRQAAGAPLTPTQRVALYRYRSRPAFRALLARAASN